MMHFSGPSIIVGYNSDIVIIVKDYVSRDKILHNIFLTSMNL